jgi:hypothetical protein
MAQHSQYRSTLAQLGGKGRGQAHVQGFVHLFERHDDGTILLSLNFLKPGLGPLF